MRRGRIYKVLIGSMIALNSLIAINTFADEMNYTYLGVVKEYKVDTQEVALISKDYSKAYKVYQGQVINEPGTYKLRLKDSDKVIGFEIDDNVNPKVTNDEEFKEAIRQALYQMSESVTIKIDNNYFKNYKDVPKQVSRLINETLHEYPLLMYDGGSFSRTGNTMTINFKYPMERSRGLEVTKKIEKGIENYINQLNLTLSDIDLQKEIVYDILDLVEYNEYSRDVKDVPLSHFLQGLADDNKLVCDGYTKAFMSIANTVGIPTQMVIGTGGGQPHAWNIVTHNGQNYHVDLTWADDEYRVTDYVNYVNEKDSFMELTHEWDREKYPVCNMNDYINTKIYELIDIEELKRSSKIDPTKSIIADINDESAIDDIVNKYGRGIGYVKSDKYGKRVITVTK